MYVCDYMYWCCAVGILLVTTSRSYGCVPQCYQVNSSTCNETTVAKYKDTAETVVMTMMAPEVVLPEWQAQRDRVIITLLCLKQKISVEGYCMRETKVINSSSCSSIDVATSCLATTSPCGASCENATTRCACKSFYIFVYDTKADTVLPSSTLVTALEEDGAKLALKAAGFAIVSFVTTQSAVEQLFNAPLQSWVLVGVGVVVAVLFGTKPFWWDRCLHRRSKDEEGIQEQPALEQPTPEKS